jgi:hypothetical protein
MRLKLRFGIAPWAGTLITVWGHGWLQDDVKRVAEALINNGSVDLGVRKGVAAVWTPDYPFRHFRPPIRWDVSESKRMPLRRCPKCTKGTERNGGAEILQTSPGGLLVAERRPLTARRSAVCGEDAETRTYASPMARSRGTLWRMLSRCW